MTGWSVFAAALIVFLLSHAIPTRPAVRGWLIGAVGRRAYFLVYSLLSTAVLIWLIATAAYLVLLLSHAPVIGLSPLP